MINDYKVNGKRSIADVERHFKLHLTPHFTGWRAANISTVEVRAYVAKRQEQKASNATINRELSALKRAFSLGIEAGKLTVKPKITLLEERNVRKGWFEPEQFEAVRSRLPAAVQPVVMFLYLTGWRLGEVLSLQWRLVDFVAGCVRLDPGTTKNDEAREFPFTEELRELLEAQREYTRQVEREQGRIIPYVFHRNGTAMKGFRKSWATACKAVGCPGMIRHDFRRTAVRNLVRAGIPERVAMTMTGHKTRSVFERYNIVSPSDLTDAAAKLDAAAKKLTGKVRAK